MSESTEPSPEVRVELAHGTWVVGTPVDDWQKYFIVVGYRRFLDPDTGKLWRSRRTLSHTEEWESFDLHDHLRCCVHQAVFRACRCFDGWEEVTDPFWDT